MRFLKVALASVLVSLLLGGCTVTRPSSVPTPTRAPTPTQRPPFATPTPTPTPPPALTPTPTLPPGTPIAEANIVVTEPTVGQRVKSPIRVAGRARVFEAQFQVVLRNQAGTLLVQQSVMASVGAPEWGEFSLELPYASPGRETLATLEVFSQSPRDGSVINLVRVPVTLLPP